jgi:hypothetical protein
VPGLTEEARTVRDTRIPSRTIRELHSSGAIKDGCVILLGTRGKCTKF